MLRALTLSLLLAGSVAAQSNPIVASLSCSPFDWAAVDGVSERAALTVPVTLAGKPYRLQLSTGATYSRVYGDIAARGRWTQIGGAPFLVPEAQIGGRSTGPLHILSQPQIEADADAQGVLGLDLLVGQLVVIDYPGQRFCLMPRAAAPDGVWNGTAWDAAEIRDGKLFLPVTADGHRLDGVYFDTGSGEFPVLLDYTPWRVLTGLDSPDEATERRDVSYWGQVTTFVGAPAPGTLKVGGATVEPTVFFAEGDPDGFAEAFSMPGQDGPPPVEGRIGNAAFWDRVVVLDLGVEPRFGVMR